MSNTVITNYTDLNGPSTKTDSSVVVIVNKDGSLSVDQKLLGTLMDSGAEMLQSLRIETRENSLLGFHNDHCYTPLTSPSQSLPQSQDALMGYDEPVIEISHSTPPKPVSTPKKITILDQKIIPKGKKILINPKDSPVIIKGKDVLHKPLPLSKAKSFDDNKNEAQKSDEPSDSSSACSSGESPADRDSDSDYKDSKDKSTSHKVKAKVKSKPRILKSVQSTKSTKLDPKLTPRLKANKNLLKRELKERVLAKNLIDKKGELNQMANVSLVTNPSSATIDTEKLFSKITPKSAKKERKTPAHVNALLSDMSSLFSTPDVIRRVSTETKLPGKPEKEIGAIDKAQKEDSSKLIENVDQQKSVPLQKPQLKQLKLSSVTEKGNKNYDPIPQLDDASLAQILQDPPQTASKSQPTISTANVINSPGLAGPLSPTLDLLAGLQPEEDGLTEDLLMHVAQLVESSENLQEVIDKQVLGKVDAVTMKPEVAQPLPQTPTPNAYAQTPVKSVKVMQPRKDPIEIIRRDGRVITLPPIEAPATRASKRKNQVESVMPPEPVSTPITNPPVSLTPEPIVTPVSRQYSNKKLITKKQEQVVAPMPVASQIEAIEKTSAESQESWNSEDDPNRLWCICKQPHNNRFMICCDGCEDWFHGKCVNITKAIGQQMEEDGIEWRCPNCVKKAKSQAGAVKNPVKMITAERDTNKEDGVSTPLSANTKEVAPKTICIVCKKAARASSIYCSDACILKHAQDSLGAQAGTSRSENTSIKTTEKHSESRVIVYERKSGRLLAGPNAPTAENLKAWLQKNPTFEVVRPGTLSTIKPNLARKKSSEPNKIQTTLNFARIPKKAENVPVKKTENVPVKKIENVPVKKTENIQTRKPELIPVKKADTLGRRENVQTKIQPTLLKSPRSQQMLKMSQMTSPTEEVKSPQPRTPGTPRLQQTNMFDTPKSSKAPPEPKKIVRATSRTQTPAEKPAVTPSTSKRKDTPDKRQNRMSSEEPIRENVRKALHEQMTIRMGETTGPKFTDEEIQEFAYETESELHELFNRDVGMKYKAKYRSLMFNIKDRKNLSLWEKICERTITPKQLVRLSPEELASQELAQWRDKEAKHQLELIKKSELDLLAASKTYVLKTHKGEEVMETKESVSTELDPNVAVEDLVSVLNDGDAPPEEPETPKIEVPDRRSTRKKDKENESQLSKKDKRDEESKRDLDDRKSQSSRRKSDQKVKEHRSSRRSGRSSRSERKSRSRSRSRERSRRDKSGSRDRRHRSRSRDRSKRKSKEHSRSSSRSREQTRSSKRRSSRRSSSRDSLKQKRRRRSRSKHRSSTEDKTKLRSKSQETAYRKKNDSTDSDSIERPKSAMTKEAHPEYDPHEPMITSAFSEEDLRKSKDDVYEEIYKNDIVDYGGADYDTTKDFSIGSSILADRYIEKQDKEVESDQEPTSTMDSSVATVWNGCINMVDVARFYVAAHEVSGNALDLEEDLTPELDIVGRINPDTVWDYISKMKRASNKDIIILKLQAANDEEKMQYIALYSYLSTRNRLGVVKVTNTATVKDLYIVPLSAGATLPRALLPLDRAPPDSRTHLLLAVIVRQRRRRHPAPPEPHPAKVVRESRKKSYTPPLSPRHRTLPLPAYTSPALSTSVKDKIAATLASADDDEAYSPGSSTGSSGNSGNAVAAPPSSNTLRTKMEELNRQIEEQKQQILKMAQGDTSATNENEAYSPSRPLTPPPVVPLADISLPSNLQEILATIKQRTENVNADVDMRTLPL
ncbi:death-inducer obliterator 1 isoform X2 [Aricia agestis]|uniref:death-inducer obliterator 1 isoform X2 n=1 Tax=Aricia agestis TaxID=91739 RepID=UPI001C2067B7|nr:death-inducer obliterator 1 isoform X2 [Aricia agestis]